MQFMLTVIIYYVEQSITLAIKYVNKVTLSNKMCENVGYVWDIVGKEGKEGKEGNHRFG